MRNLSNDSKFIQQHLANERTYLAWVRLYSHYRSGFFGSRFIVPFQYGSLDFDCRWHRSRGSGWLRFGTGNL